MRNLTLAMRMLARTPVVTAIAVLPLGLGIGSNAAIYSIFHRMLRQDLRVAEPRRLVNISAPGPQAGRHVVQRRRQLRRCPELPHVPRSPAVGPEGVHVDRRPSRVRGQRRH